MQTSNQNQNNLPSRVDDALNERIREAFLLDVASRYALGCRILNSVYVYILLNIDDSADERRLILDLINHLKTNQNTALRMWSECNET